MTSHASLPGHGTFSAKTARVLINQNGWSPGPQAMKLVTMQESKEIFWWQAWSVQSRRGRGAAFSAVYLKDDTVKAELTNSCFAFVLSGKKNDLQAKKNEIKIG